MTPRTGANLATAARQAFLRDESLMPLRSAWLDAAA